MLEIFLQIVPFFALIGLGFGSVRAGLFTAEANAHLTRFVFYFALSAMLFRFAATLPISTLFDLNFGMAYLAGCAVVYVAMTLVALLRGTGWAIAAVEAQCGVIGNVGFLGIPILVSLMGDAAAGPVLFVLAIDLIVFGSLLVIIITASREGAVSAAAVGRLGLGLLQNPMLVAMAAGLLWSGFDLPVAGAFDRFLNVLGSAATPCALFAIGASLAQGAAERPGNAIWLTTAKLALHPIAVAYFALWVFEVDRFAAGVMVAAAAMPVAGNVFLVAQHYGVAPVRVSSAIFVSTLLAILTLAPVIAWVGAAP
ncbi:MAG: AEC family transporter [Pseudomonadota bacterium]